MGAVDDSGRFQAAIEAFDAANAADPHRERDGDREQPRELLYAQRMSAMLARFAPQAPETVQLAARCQHLRRWEIPRDRYPRTPQGYHAWRRRLMDFHAAAAGELLRAAGYGEPIVQRVQALLRKEQLKRDPEAQLLEDVVGLVFFGYYLQGFVDSHPEYDESRLLDILRKTGAKMSAPGREAALRLPEVPETLRAVLRKALCGE